MTAPPRRVRALSVGPAAAPALAGGAALRVHGVFASTVSLEVIGAGAFVALAGPGGAVLPHAVTLGEAHDFPGWRLVVGAPVAVRAGVLALPAAAGEIEVSLTEARRPAPRPLPPIAAIAGAWAACAQRLAELQATAGAELRIGGLRGATAGAELRIGELCGATPPPTPLGAGAGAALTLALTRAAAALAAAHGEAIPGAVAALVGLGPGLTPAGDDFLAGQLAAARAAGDGSRAAALGEAIARDLSRTTALSAFLLRCALRGLWPGPLVDLAAALAADREAEGVAAIEALGLLGHSSGLDLATGLLAGLGGDARP